jgi:hypothetical protein
MKYRERQIIKHDKRDELPERPHPVFADRIGDCPEYTERRHPHDQAHRPEQYGGDRVDQRSNLFALLAADQRQRDAEDQRGVGDS